MGQATLTATSDDAPVGSGSGQPVSDDVLPSGEAQLASRRSLWAASLSRGCSRSPAPAHPMAHSTWPHAEAPAAPRPGRRVWLEARPRGVDAGDTRAEHRPGARERPAGGGGEGTGQGGLPGSNPTRRCLWRARPGPPAATGTPAHPPPCGLRAGGEGSEKSGEEAQLAGGSISPSPKDLQGEVCRAKADRPRPRCRPPAGRPPAGRKHRQG